MNRHLQLDLSETEADFIARAIDEGQYQRPDDVVHAALDLLQQNGARLKALDDALEEGERSGESTPFDFDEFLSRQALSSRA